MAADQNAAGQCNLLGGQRSGWSSRAANLSVAGPDRALPLQRGVHFGGRCRSGPCQGVPQRPGALLRRIRQTIAPIDGGHTSVISSGSNATPLAGANSQIVEPDSVQPADHLRVEAAMQRSQLHILPSSY